ncbi:cysteine protease StiP family protein [Neptunomonas japonica]|uniref:cysteine protease StiP family protein n=1 Tax=Neptunomonas japonica TaxID=417574 RepID=UPI00041D4F5F|nr:cysteine protease StiP family protein [Neptunomonas japonica]
MSMKLQTVLKPLKGSYSIDDCQFLLQAIDIPMLTVEEKERQMQIGGQHYSAMISQEYPPSDQYLTLFFGLVDKYKQRLAAEVAGLAKQIFDKKGDTVTLVSLARAGTPIGVLLNRALKHYYNVDVSHYSISIIRDKGIDRAALSYLEKAGHAAESILFVDGWTAKGIITQELKAAIADWNNGSDYKVSDELCVISDIGGMADLVATVDDYTIPSGILNSTVSGLVSRTILRPEYQGFHQCVVYSHLAKHDLSNWFVDEVSALFSTTSPDESAQRDEVSNERHQKMKVYIDQLMVQYGVTDINRVKPGIAEATRVMLRRVPKLLVVKNRNSADVSHLLVLAKDKGIQVYQDGGMPFNAVAIVANVSE